MQGHMAGINAKMQEYLRAEVVGVKPIRFFGQLTTPAVAGGYVVSAGTYPIAGYVWALQTISVVDTAAIMSAAYLTRATDNTPFALIANVPDAYTASKTLYVLSTVPDANNLGFAQRFSGGQALYNAGEIPAVIVRIGVAQITTITIVGNVVEVPAEMVGKLLM